MDETILYADGLYHVYESKAEDGNVVALRGLHIDTTTIDRISNRTSLMIWLGDAPIA